MKDALGLYYFPDLSDRTTRMYVRNTASGEIEFRLWMESKPEVWERHPWTPYAAIKAAHDLYKQEHHEPHNNPLELYDLSLAKALIYAEEESR